MLGDSSHSTSFYTPDFFRLGHFVLYLPSPDEDIHTSHQNPVFYIPVPLKPIRIPFPLPIPTTRSKYLPAVHLLSASPSMSFTQRLCIFQGSFGAPNILSKYFSPYDKGSANTNSSGSLDVV
jgi:hypothetical protein